ncbi:MAG: hypothetical protein HFE49_07520 [Clostridia bacterium]|nr:hypothetical protein [Clostridia bacterium]
MVLLTIGIISAALAVAGLSIYWKNIVQWIQRVWQKLQERIQGVIEGVKTFILKTKEGFKNSTKYYSRDKITEEWQETVVLKPVDESEIPKAILQRIKSCSIGSEIETTEELLTLTV